MVYYRCGGGEKGFYPSILVTGLSETDTVYAEKDGKRYASKWVEREVEVLPAEYQEVEYIQSSGTQYINSGVVIDSESAKTEIGVTPMFESGETYYIGRNDGTNPHRFILGQYQGKYYWEFGTNYVGYSSNAITANKYSDLELEYNNGSTAFVVDGVKSTGSTTQTISGTQPLYLFARNLSGSPTLYSSAKIHYCRIYKNGILVRNFIPCYRKSDNVAGLYDTVNDAFYINQGTGTFTVGADVDHPVKCWLFDKLPSLGMYTVTATNGTQTATQEVLVDMVTEYVVEMGYIRYLYNLGDECEGITGGWTNSGYSDGSVSIRPATKNEDNIYVQAQSSSETLIGTNNAIDLSGYTKMYVDCVTSGASGAMAIACMPSKSVGNYLAKNEPVHTVRTTVEIDVSAINTNCYVTMFAGNVTSRYFTVYAIWLE